VWWNAQTDEQSGGFRDGGYWVVSKHEDIKEISRQPEIFSSQRKGAIIRLPGMVNPEQIEFTSALLINMDPPRHSKVRRIVSRGFTPRAIEGMRAALTERAERIVHAAMKDGSGDFVEQVACELPLKAIAELLGVPQADRHKLFEWSNQMLNYDDPEYVDTTSTDSSVKASVEILGCAWQMAEQRRANPLGDIVSQLVQADVDGEALSSDEFGFFVILLSVAGNETTCNAITHGMKAFVDNPEQWELFKQERPRTAADEIVRWATPVTVQHQNPDPQESLGNPRSPRHPGRPAQRLRRSLAGQRLQDRARSDRPRHRRIRRPDQCRDR
jgi:cholest-4-en-3-one 26-monooxygenase